MTYRLDLSVINEYPNDTPPRSRMGLTLHNLTDRALEALSIAVLFDRFINPNTLSQGSIEQVGSYCIITPAHQTLDANQSLYIEFDAHTLPLRFLCAGFKDALLYANGEQYSVMLTPINLAHTHTTRSTIPDVHPAEHAIIPVPKSVRHQPGYFTLSPTTPLIAVDPQALPAAQWLSNEWVRMYPQADIALDPRHQDAVTGDHAIILRPLPDSALRDIAHRDEAYQLTVTDQGVVIQACAERGFIHGCASLLQLCQEQDTQLRIPAIKISDAPRFAYRGMMLDCARHFHSVDTVKRLINQLAYFKFNTFHWHLTDDEGWRLEIKALPELTRYGSQRGPNTRLAPQFSHIAERHEGYYRQEDVRDVIEYAAARGITVIPEIDIPGHCRAAIKALPDWLQDDDDRSTYRSVQHYTDNVLSPALEGTYRFLDTVLSEVAELFPASWVHIGADEVPEGVWTDSPIYRDRRMNGETTASLQGQILTCAEQKLRALGKRMVGWEEVQHGDKVSKNTVIYSWQSEDAALHCAQHGFDVILTPGQATYLDMVQDYAATEPGLDWAGVTPLEKAYQYEPLASLASDDPAREHMLGVQCALWSELITNQDRLDYMVFPRLTAIAEAAWSHSERRDWLDYLARLKAQLPRLDKLGIQYRSPWASNK
ncbi:beta-hexosaminidase [Salinivibrio kushneri]|uniref:beta-N-acetylhexosaminidase n=1 Tax=Salinivibrio kushneri TaxID=1908198 RepID=UPI000988F6BA|nr:family 20 glycosylhydrolase [Salinivibrio kushneri]OOE36045.1 beta-hexosaminidase [Salinivibrio kushneri]